MMKKQSFEIKNVSHDMICVYEYSTSEPRSEVPKPVGGLWYVSVEQRFSVTIGIICTKRITHHAAVVD